MSDVKRYHAKIHGDPHSWPMVHASDYDALLAERDALLEENERLKAGALEDLKLRTSALELMNAAHAERDRLQVFNRSLDEEHARLTQENDQYHAELIRLRAEVEASAWIPLAKATPPEGVPVLRWPGWAAEISIDEWCNDYGCFLMDIEGGGRATHWKLLSAPDAPLTAKEA